MIIIIVITVIIIVGIGVVVLARKDEKFFDRDKKKDSLNK